MAGTLGRHSFPVDFPLLKKIFRHKVLNRLRCRGKITEELIRMISGWRHSGSNVFCGPKIHPRGKSPWRTWPHTSSGHPFPRNAQNTSWRKPGLFATQKTAKTRRPMMPLSGWSPWEAMSLTEDSNPSVITVNTRTRPGAGAKKKDEEDPIPTVLEPEFLGSPSKKRESVSFHVWTG